MSSSYMYKENCRPYELCLWIGDSQCNSDKIICIWKIHSKIFLPKPRLFPSNWTMSDRNRLALCTYQTAPMCRFSFQTPLCRVSIEKNLCYQGIPDNLIFFIKNKNCLLLLFNRNSALIPHNRPNIPPAKLLWEYVTAFFKLWKQYWMRFTTI